MKEDLRLIENDQDVVHLCKSNEREPSDTIILYVESGNAPLAVEVPDGGGVGVGAGVGAGVGGSVGAGVGGSVGAGTGGDGTGSLLHLTQFQPLIHLIQTLIHLNQTQMHLAQAMFLLQT